MWTDFLAVLACIGAIYTVLGFLAWLGEGLERVHRMRDYR